MAFKIDDSQDEPLSEINVVPLVDIILVVLIIFMVTAPMIMKPSIKVNLPKAQSGEKTESSKLGILLSKDGKILLNGKIVSLEDVKIAAIEEVKKNSEVQAIISADKEVSHGQVVNLLDTIKAVGVNKFAISIEKSL